MIYSLKIKLIRNLIKLIELIQALTNNDIYSIIRIKQYNDLKSFLDNNFSNSYYRWEKNYNYLDKDLSLLHNISYNHWIRSDVAINITEKNILLNFSSYIAIIKNFFLLIFFYLKVKSSQIKFDRKIIYINKQKVKSDIKFEFLSAQKENRFREIANYLENNFVESIKYENISFVYQFKITNFKLKDPNKISALSNVIKYCFKYPFMAKHYKNLFQGLYIYNYFKKYSPKKNYFSLSKEIYSMETRSLSIASAKYKKATYTIKHNKFEALPYDMYSLNINKIPIYLENNLTAKEKTFNKEKLKNSIFTIVIQASDSCGSTISSYEYNTYKEIINVLYKLDYDCEIIFKFHPANMNFFINLKKEICRYFLRNSNIKFKFIHKTKNIEYYASGCNFVISIDYSTSFLEILKMDIPIIYFNRNYDRHIVNTYSKINEFKNFTMVSNKKDLESKLKHLIR